MMFRQIARINHWLDKSNEHLGSLDDGMRVLKLTEEAGEAAAAYIGHLGQNPRKGVTHSLEDFLSELADVAITAFCAMEHFAPGEAERVVTAKLSAIEARIPVAS